MFAMVVAAALSTLPRVDCLISDALFLRARGELPWESPEALRSAEDWQRLCSADALLLDGEFARCDDASCLTARIRLSHQAPRCASATPCVVKSMLLPHYRKLAMSCVSH